MPLNTHVGKAESYNLGRPAYPDAFYDYLYGEFGLSAKAVVADIGAGPGKVSRPRLGHVPKRGTFVFWQSKPGGRLF